MIKSYKSLVIALVFYSFLVFGLCATNALAVGGWTLLDGELNIPRHVLTGETLNGYVYAIGGVVMPGSPSDSRNTVSRYDPATDSWSLVTSVPTARHSLSSAVIDGWIYTVGGHVSNSRSENERYNGTSWESRAPVYARSAPGVAAFGGELYVFGGNHYGMYQSRLSRFDIYNPTTDTWRIGGEMPAAGVPHRAVTMNGKMYLGTHLMVPTNDEIWSYDPADGWDTDIPPFNVPRWNYEIAAADGRIYIIGGANTSGFLSSVESWAPGEGSWRIEPSLNIARSQFASAVIGNDIYVFGGLNDDGDLGSTEVLTISEPVIEVAIDIKPESCPNPLRVNFRGNGVIPVAILGSDDFNVFDIDITTITLEGVAPIRSSFENASTPFDGEECECSTEEPDEYLDLVLKFSRAAIIAALEDTHGDFADLPNRAELTLTLTAMLIGEDVELEGTDCLTILNRGTIKRSRR